jgi:hypothetical protein
MVNLPCKQLNHKYRNRCVGVKKGIKFLVLDNATSSRLSARRIRSAARLLADACIRSAPQCCEICSYQFITAKEAFSDFSDYITSERIMPFAP